MNITTCLNERYIPYVYVLLKSFFLSNGGGHRVYLLEDGLTTDGRRNLSEICSENESECIFIGIDIDGVFLEASDKNGWDPAVCYRLLLWDVLPDDLDRILYLDGDIVVNQNLDELYHTPFDGMDMIGCRDEVSYATLYDSFLESHSEEFRDLYVNRKYINSGVIVYNLKTGNRSSFTSRYIKVANELSNSLPYPDQDIINLVHCNHIKYIDTYRFNFPAMAAAILNGGYDYGRAKKEIAILHYVDSKPWDGSNHIPYELESIWWENAFSTPYAECLMRDYILALTQGHIREEYVSLMNENRQLRADLNESIASFSKLLNSFYTK